MIHYVWTVFWDQDPLVQTMCLLSVGSASYVLYVAVRDALRAIRDDRARAQRRVPYEELNRHRITPAIPFADAKRRKKEET